MLEVKMPPLHDGQAAVVHDPTRIRVLACGRRWGKTRLGAALCIAAALDGGRAWWVAPSYKMAAVGWRLISTLAVQVPGTQISRSERMASLVGGGTVQVRSADNPDSLRGEGLDFVVLDECAFMPEIVWTASLRPALSDRQGRALFISTPKGRTWFWRLWTQGQVDGAEVKSWNFATSDNPYIPADEIEAARQSLPDRIFRQEYLAEFIDDAGGVFRRVVEATTATWQDSPTPGRTYIFGVDWAKYNDYTVIVVLDANKRQVVHLDRFNQIDTIVQLGRLRALAERFRPQAIWAERNSLGEPLVEQLQRDGLPVFPFTTDAASKTRAIDALTLAFERQEIAIVPDPVLVAELQAYEMERMPSGYLRYSAPDGMHDDCVMALAIAWHGARYSATTAPSLYN